VNVKHKFIGFAKTQTELDDTHTDFNSSMAIVEGKPGMIEKGLVHGTPFEWKIDTGAINTFITEDLYYSILLGERPVLERAWKKFETADGPHLMLLELQK
jgi:hypothetical protein